MSARPKPIAVLIVEDSAVQRELLCAVLAADPGLRVAGTARDGIEAIGQAAALRPDVIVMDVNMPRLNGLEATRRILTEMPVPIVVASASFVEREAELSFAALEAGALAVVAKPAGLDHPDHEDVARRLVSTVKLMSEVTVVRRWPRGAEPTRPVPLPPRPRPGVRIVAIAASTGGPAVIADVLRGVAGSINAAVLIVQHMAPGFIVGFAEWLAQRTGLSAGVAQEGEAILPRRAYLAPDGSQMGVTPDGRIAIRAGDGATGFCPSGSHLLTSVAEHYGAAAIGIVLSGMGGDGAQGLLKLREAGGLTIAQEAGSCAVFGMPKEAIACGAAMHVLAPDAIAALVRAAANPG